MHVILRIGLAAAALSAFSGCLGGDQDRPTYDPGTRNPDPIGTPDTAKPVSVHPLYPPLAAGDTWTFAQAGDGYSGAVAALVVLGDSVYGSDSVYVQTIKVDVPLFLTSYGDTVRQFSQTGRMYLRKADQETVRDTLITEALIHYVGDTADTPYRLEEGSRSVLKGALPDSLKAGAAWKLTATRHRYSRWWFGDVPGGSRDTTTIQTRSYAVSASPDITVKAGAFQVLKVAWSIAETGASSVGWFAPGAKSVIREIDTDAGSADTTELTAYSVK